MGVCAACCQQPLAKAERERRTRPLLFDLERAAWERGGRPLDLEELVRLWKAETTRRCGKLTAEDIQLIEHGATEAFRDMDVDQTGEVSLRDFVMHAMGGTEVRAGLRDLRQKLHEEMKRNPRRLQDLVSELRSWDLSGDGRIASGELDLYLERLRGGVAVSGCSLLPLCGSTAPPALADGRLLAQAENLRDELLTAAGVDSDGRLDLWELVEWGMGRRKTPVELILYDISKGIASWAGPLLLDRTDVEAFHSSLLVFGSEYWYGGRVFRSDPPCEKQFGKPMSTSKKKGLKFERSEAYPEVHVIRLGYTLATHDEFLDFLKSKVIERYTGAEAYDLVSCSCNHFSDECLHFLVGQGLPDDVFDLQQSALSPALMALRPLLNRALGAFSTLDGGGERLLEDCSVTAIADIEPNEILGPGAVVLVDSTAAGLGVEGGHVVATVLEEQDDRCKVRYFDPSSLQVSTRDGVPTDAILKHVSS